MIDFYCIVKHFWPLCFAFVLSYSKVVFQGAQAVQAVNDEI